MREVFQVLNQLQSEGFFSRWAIGGAMGLNYYVDPVETFDLDVFVFFNQPEGRLLIDLGPLYSALRGMGYEASQEHVIIGGVPVQFLDAASPLEREGVEQARKFSVAGEAVWVLPAEHLVALMIQTWRPKDRLRFGVLTWNNPGFYSGRKVAALARRFHFERNYEKARKSLCD